MIAFKDDGVLLRQEIKATGIYNNQTKFDFQYLGASAKIKPLGSQA